MKKNGFTMIEVAIAVGILGILSLIITILLIRSLDTYTQVVSDTETIKQGRQCLNQIVYEMRESTLTDMWVTTEAAGGELDMVQDALLLGSARVSDAQPNPNAFNFDANTFEPTPSSIILYYVYTTPEGNPQLRRLQLYYAEDLAAFNTESVTLLASGPYVGSNIVLVDKDNVQILVDMATGVIGGESPHKPPRVIMNRLSSFDVIAGAPPEIRITCQFMDRFGRTATTRLRTEIDPRNS